MLGKRKPRAASFSLFRAGVLVLAMAVAHVLSPAIKSKGTALTTAEATILSHRDVASFAPYKVIRVAVIATGACGTLADQIDA